MFVSINRHSSICPNEAKQSITDFHLESTISALKQIKKTGRGSPSLYWRAALAVRITPLSWFIPISSGAQDPSGN